MATLRLRLERWFARDSGAYFLRATVEPSGSVPPGIIDSLKVERANLVSRVPEKLIGFCTLQDLEYLAIGSDLEYVYVPEVDAVTLATLPGSLFEISVTNIPKPWESLGLMTAISTPILSVDTNLFILKVDTIFPCGVKPISYFLPSVPFNGIDGFPVRERQGYGLSPGTVGPEIPHVRMSSFVAPYDDLAGVTEMMETLKTEAQALVDEWNTYEADFEGLDLEIFE